MRNENTKMKFTEPNEIKINLHFFLKNIKENTWFIQTEENLSKVYNSHKVSVSSQFQSPIYHKSIFQIISHQIKDKVHNRHGSLGILGLILAWRKSWFFWIFKHTFKIGEQTKKPSSNSNEWSLSILFLLPRISY